MKLKFLIALLFLNITNSFAASFDCSKAKSPIEKSICADSKLSGLDDQLGNTYGNLRAKLSETAKTKLRNHQSNWVKSLTQDCSDAIQTKDNKKIASCLINYYESRVQFLNELNQAINGNFKYPTLGKTNNITYELLDNNSAAANLVNDTVEKIVAATEVGKEDNLDINLSALGKSIITITANYESNGGAHPDFGASYRYIDIKQLKELKPEDFLLKNKWPELAKLVIKKMNTGADQETKDCYSGIDDKAIVEILKNNFTAIQISNKGISILLGVPRYCRNNDFFDLDSASIKPFMTNTFKSFAP